MNQKNCNLLYPDNAYDAIFGSSEHHQRPPDSQKALEYVLGLLPAEEADMFLLRHRDGMSYAKIGEKYGVTMDTALRTIQRIQRKLRHPSKSRVLFFGEEACRKERAEENAEWIRLYNEQIDPLQNAGPSPDADISIEDMYLSTRSFNCLSRAGVKTVKDIIRYGSLINVRNLGSTGIEEIQYKLDCILEALPQLRNI